ncbi:Alkyl hydroperoxide reductase subunit C/ Thiol specific antioxidant [Penicillium soppii]|uniref:Alkyl hydroperoxide reductase subunit C/ Thiol specific antioxidant n=1 Tax=Penicillium soppii TaxID=69789 RepID=UPI002547E669|nr:Alkyl hydroperoxide reductase subunit C/ Thiol specific antioxidant [Penicillium soppii]KAJ5882169.1 Alkyl hydroperoxide reductase subunit C/ Thiol specific antioxidant [Penicillium soppii]
MVELRKRKAPAPPVPEKKIKAPKKEDTVNNDIEETSPKVLEVDDIIDLETFGGEIETNDGETTSLKKLLEESKSGVVLFTYPKASTPGCTKQACLFRDNHTHLTSSGLSIYGLSGDSPKANTTFKTKQNLQYPLLCDPKATLIAAIGLKKSPKGTMRGVFAVDKKGKILLREAGGPDATVDAVQKIVANASKDDQEDKQHTDEREDEEEN